VVADRHLRHVGKDCLVAYAGNLYSVPARRVRHRQLVEIRTTAATVAVHATMPDLDGNTLLAAHQRAVGRRARIVDETHWDGLPDGHTRAVTTGDHTGAPARRPSRDTPPARCRPCSPGPPPRRSPSPPARCVGLRPDRRHEAVHTRPHPSEGRLA
jgi:hypothetical protein